MGLVAPPTYVFQGVDTRSNPLNRPYGKALLCKNWIPTEAGYLKLRNGYTELSMSAVTAPAIHSLHEYKLWDGTRYVLFAQGTSLKRYAVASGTVTTIATLSSSADCEFERSDNKILIVNGTDQKFYDGTTLRDIGIQAATAAQVASVTVTEVLRDYTSGEASGVTVGQNAAGGNFAATTKSGYLLYGHYVDATSANGYGHGPARLLGTGARITFASGSTNRITTSGLPTSYTGKLKVYSITGDGTSISKFCTVGSAAISNLSFNTSSRVMTVTATGHGFSAGDVIEIAVTGWEGVFVIGTVPDANTLTYTDLIHRADAGSTGAVSGTVYKLLSTALATTTQDITAITTGSMQANGEVGLPASTVGGSQPGYSVAVSIYNPTTGAAGNYRAITGRLLSTTNRCVYHIEGLTSLSGVDSEFRWMFGRTGDGAVVPYPITDSALNRQYIDNARTSFVLRESSLEAKEMPATNDKPSGLARITKVGARLFGGKANSPYIYNTPAGDIVGKREQSWDEDAFNTFPTGDNTLAQCEYEQELVVWTESDVAILTELSGVLDWRGPWNIGIAGPRAWVKTPYGLYWVTGDKRLAKVSPEGPLPVSGEYELGTLSDIGDSYLADVEICYQNDQDRKLDRLIINCRESDGTPFQVYHDFNLDGPEDGQGYTSVFTGQLASAFTMKMVRDSNRKLRTWCGGADGRLYELETGADDDGTNFTAEYIALVNLGEMRVSNPWEEFYGDEQIKVYHGKDLDTTLADIQDESLVLGRGKTYEPLKNRVTRKADGVDNPQYFRIVLTSHPSDAASPSNPMAPSDPPQLPVESYGRFYGFKAALADPRGE